MFLNLIWDVGGTLFDTYPATVAAFQAALAERGVSTPTERVRVLALTSQQHAARALAEEHGLEPDGFYARYRALLRAAPPRQQPPFPGVLDVLEKVKARGRLNLIATHRARELAEALLAAHNLAGFFNDLLSTSDGYPRKPDPAMLNLLVERHGLRRAETLALGDREIDMQAARAAGLPTALFRGPADVAADFHFQDYRELLEIL